MIRRVFAKTTNRLNGNLEFKSILPVSFLVRTYNQGVILVGLGYIYKCQIEFYLLGCTLTSYTVTGDFKVVQYAGEIMNAIKLDLTKDGALHESCDSDPKKPCNADQQSFKGILVGYMYVSRCYLASSLTDGSYAGRGS